MAAPKITVTLTDLHSWKKKYSKRRTIGGATENFGHVGEGGVLVTNGDVQDTVVGEEGTRINPI